MTRDDITRMAKEAGLEAFKYPSMISEEDWQVLERFAKLVRNDYSNKHAQLWLKRIDDAVKAEREKIAQFIESTNLGSLPEQTAVHYANLLRSYSTAIRARGEQ